MIYVPIYRYKALITKFQPLTLRPRGPGASKPFLVVQYQCNQGYEFLDEAEFLFCRDYNWVQTAPVCVPSGKNLIVTFICNIFFDLNGKKFGFQNLLLNIVKRITLVKKTMETVATFADI